VQTSAVSVSTADAFYLPRSEGHYVATEACGGPWDPQFSHGGPPAALLARAVEREPGDWPATVVRLAVEILGPVPLGDVAVESHVVRRGRTVELVEAELVAGGRPAVRCRAWRIRRAELDLPASIRPSTDTPTLPDQDSAPPDGWPGGFVASLQWRFSEGHWNSLGPATCWARQTVALVEDEPPTGLQRMMVLADCGNGISNDLPIDQWMFINPDLTVHLTREPVGEWLCLSAATTADPAGFGVATSRLYDTSGLVAHGAQSLYVGPRPS
jgi:hypothetical protein